MLTIDARFQTIFEESQMNIDTIKSTEFEENQFSSLITRHKQTRVEAVSSV